MSAVQFNGIYSRPWLGRCFILEEGSLRWGRYTILDKKIARDCTALRAQLAGELSKVDPRTLAATFEDLIHLYIPRALPDYLLEVDALATLEYSKAHLAALGASHSNVDDFLLAREALASSFERAFKAVFRAAQPMHGLTDCLFVKSQPFAYGTSLAYFAKDNLIYLATFSPDLILKCIDVVNAPKRLWSFKTNESF